MTTPRAFALIPAAGMGKRMGASINKQYLHLQGKPILSHTLAVFEASPLISGICLVSPADEIPFCRDQVIGAGNLRKVIEVVPGGAERQHSVMNGLRALERHAAPDDVILIHDGVRPFVTGELLERSIATAGSSDGALVAVPAKDTIKSVREGVVVATPPRETLWLAQTPQAFRFGIIFDAHLAAEREGFLGTDDASLVERVEGRVRIVPGDYRNIKITTPEDLILAEAFLAIPAGNGACP